MITHEMLTGRSAAHLVIIDDGPHRLQKEAAQAFEKMRLAAREAGFDLQPASTFRDFDRQLAIWNGKFRGERPVLDKNSQPVDVSALTTAERCELILRWSALPGASRHHWGSDLDVYDPSLLPAGKTLQLEPWEYEEGGYFYPLNQWMSAHMTEYDFYRPYAEDRGGVAVEPWHLSYRPLAAECEKQLTPQVLISSWTGKDVAAADWLAGQMDTLFPRFIALSPF
ncbi:M15 family metallopeptidase [Rahnella aceris]|jgi:LAS superfamily LD-carboxypeptidase LdcB|uniref:M15 family metallopeptidase n=1 Tax=Rahnella sp. (strain Y9602) TaxID=2703885 RepID=UPI000DC45BBA|nr:M15 family metallopeptidase [Rahnella aceris]MBU9842119.1 M15 family metallopeptidase [Rahnella aceris]